MPAPDFPASWQAFHLPKGGYSREEYEDAFAADPRAGRFAVADGAAESSFAGLWARLLVDGFVRPEPETEPAGPWLDGLRRGWAAAVDQGPLPWYAEIKRAEGAFAAFLGLEIGRAAEGGDWRAWAVGDSCLFQVRARALRASFPLTRGDEFSNQPCLLGSRTGSRLATPPRRGRGRWQTGDRFLLMTDALAQWFLRQATAERKPWEEVGRLRDEGVGEARFRAWVEGLRDGGGLRNDDVTLLVIDL
jgi:hypothetical protein